MLSGLALVGAQTAAAPPKNAPTPAPMVMGNPAMAMYTASFPKTVKIAGSVRLASGAGGSAAYSISLTGLTKELAPYMYHIHATTVPANGSCAATGAHFDPYFAGTEKPCDPKVPNLCQVGDLAGKFGNFTAAMIEDGEATLRFVDHYSSLTPGSKAYVGDKSIVIHDFKNTRLTCANLVVMGHM